MPLLPDTLHQNRTCLPVYAWVDGLQPINAQNDIMVQRRQNTTLDNREHSQSINRATEHWDLVTLRRTDNTAISQRDLHAFNVAGRQLVLPYQLLRHKRMTCPGIDEGHSGASITLTLSPAQPIPSPCVHRPQGVQFCASTTSDTLSDTPT